MYGLGDRDEVKEMRARYEARYEAMVNVLSDILSCGRWDIEYLFDSQNNIEIGEIIKNWVDETGILPDWNTIYREAAFDFASENDLEPGVDIDIYTNSCLDTHIYVRERIDEDIKEKFETLFNMEADEMTA